MSKTILVEDLSFSLFHKTCFEGFSAEIPSGSRIAIIGRNGCGKTSLLGVLRGTIKATQGNVRKPSDCILGYVPQIVDDYDSLSGGQRFNEALTDALCLNPDVLLLDEPTNHLDASNRQSLMRMLNTFEGSLIVATHDSELLDKCIDTLWHIENGRIHIFHGKYSDYMAERSLKKDSIEKEMSRLERKRKKTQKSLEKEQQRASKSRAKGIRNAQKKRVDKIAAKGMANNAQAATGRIQRSILDKRTSLSEELSDLRLPKVIKPSFHFSEGWSTKGVLLNLFDASVGYIDKKVLENVSLSVFFGDRIAISGDNGSGKSTLIKALLRKDDVVTSGQLDLPALDAIGYLDQHYALLDKEETPYGLIQQFCPQWTDGEIRSHLAEFLFMKNEEVSTLVKNLSGGEKARLCLALIAAKTPRMLILDEITNNLDMETKEHVCQVLRAYKGALIIISHEPRFLEEIEIETFYEIKEGRLMHL
jgi:ATPase subunit of ABC transporter with duplicated ATPase domains